MISLLEITLIYVRLRDGAVQSSEDEIIWQRTTSLDDPFWNDVPGSEGHDRIELPITSGNEFFRLIRP